MTVRCTHIFEYISPAKTHKCSIIMKNRFCYSSKKERHISFYRGIPIVLHVGPYTVAFLTLSHERQRARLSKITNNGLTRSGTGCFISCTYMAITVGVKGLKRTREDAACRSHMMTIHRVIGVVAGQRVIAQ